MPETVNCPLYQPQMTAKKNPAFSRGMQSNLRKTPPSTLAGFEPWVQKKHVTTRPPKQTVP
jgi:hypothetical protein